jgi:hypothetical protein
MYFTPALVSFAEIGVVYASLYIGANNAFCLYFLHILRHLDKKNWILKKSTQVPKVGLCKAGILKHILYIKVVNEFISTPSALTVRLA